MRELKSGLAQRPDVQGKESDSCGAVPEGVPSPIMEAKEALVIADQQVPRVEEQVPWPEDVLQKLPPGQLWAPRVARERGLLAHWGHQQPWLTGQRPWGQERLPASPTASQTPQCQPSPLPAALSTDLERWPRSVPGHPGTAPLCCVIADPREGEEALTAPRCRCS